MQHTPKIIVLAAVAALAAPVAGVAQDDTEKSLSDAITAGKAGINVRYRYEFVDQDGFDDNANASTVRLRLNYRTGEWRNMTMFGEFDYVGELFFNDFNSLGGSSPDRGRYPVVADPKGPDLNQLYLDLAPSEDATIRLGRQQITLDNHRYIGNVVWRQNNQTYDAAGFTFTGLNNTKVFYAYNTAVQRIFGNQVPSGRHDTDNHFLNVNVKLNDNWTVVPYYYYIDNADVAAFSTGTLGARLTGKVAAGGGSIDLVAELARQSDAANNPVDYDADYWHLAANWALGNGLTLGIAWESLGGDSNRAGASFRTPLATLHAFQGWADKFLSTPHAGIDDVFATVKYKAGVWNLTAVYHDFSAQSGSADWGSELDLSAARPLNDRYGILLKAGLYDADQHQTDTNKFWLMLTANW